MLTSTTIMHKVSRQEGIRRKGMLCLAGGFLINLVWEM